MDEIRVGIVGAGYIAALHSAAYATVPGTYLDAPRHARLVGVADIDPSRMHELQRRWGWERLSADWREITRAPDIDLVDICVPNSHHAEIAIDALAHGKHVICEKPLAHDLASAQRMWDAARRANRLAQVCFYYRLWPAIEHAARIIAAGHVGTVQHFRGWMLQDYAASPGHHLGWRARAGAAGAGALGDLGSHILDIARCLCGDITSVNALTRSPVSGDHVEDGLDDYVAMLVEFETGASGVIEAGWAARGHKADLGFDLIASDGAIRFTWERANELSVLTEPDTDAAAAGTRVLLGPAHGDGVHYAGVPGQGLGYRDAFTIGIGRALSALGRGASEAPPTFEDGLVASRAVTAALLSARTREWVKLDAVGISGCKATPPADRDSQDHN